MLDEFIVDVKLCRCVGADSYAEPAVDFSIDRNIEKTVPNDAEVIRGQSVGWIETPVSVRCFLLLEDGRSEVWGRVVGS